MQESARAAQTYVLSHASDLGIDPTKVKENGLHIHVPAGARAEGRPIGRGRVGDGPDVALHRQAGVERHRHDG